MSETQSIQMNIHEILEYLPHRYPFLLVDRVLECVPNKNITCLKNVSINEPFFPGHFPHHPVMPGVLIIEALAQAAALLSFKSLGTKPDGKTLYYFAGIDGARFKRAVQAGDQLILKVEVLRQSRAIAKYKAEAFVDGQLAAEAQLLCALREI